MLRWTFLYILLTNHVTFEYNSPSLYQIVVCPKLDGNYLNFRKFFPKLSQILSLCNFYYLGLGVSLGNMQDKSNSSST